MALSASSTSESYTYDAKGDRTAATLGTEVAGTLALWAARSVAVPIGWELRSAETPTTSMERLEHVANQAVAGNDKAARAEMNTRPRSKTPTSSGWSLVVASLMPASKGAGAAQRGPRQLNARTDLA
jgi:hypothetical protein